VMPRLDGVGATTLIRRFDARTPIISMTSRAAPGEVGEYYEHGMNDVLAKPVGRDNLLRMLEVRVFHSSIARRSRPRRNT
jgi:osomolarity two-component system response regulator SKN7